MKTTDSVGVLKSVGPQRQSLLNKLNIFTLGDLLSHYPRDYEDRTQTKPIGQLTVGVNHFICRVTAPAENIRIGGRVLTKLRVSDESGEVEIFWFNQPYIKNALKLGREYFFSGRLTEYRGRLQIESPEHYLLEEPLLSGNRIVPVYPSTAGLSQQIVRKLIQGALEVFQTEACEDFLPESLRQRYDLCHLRFALENIHFPKSHTDFFKARNRLVFDELFILQLSLRLLKDRVKLTSIYCCSHTDWAEVRNFLSFSPTSAQERAIAEIISDMSSGCAMNRLVQGDVGSGKTLVALVASYIAIKNSGQAAMMAPTELLAKQHYFYFHSFFSKLGIETVLLTGSMTLKQRREAYEKISLGEAQMIIGTQALFQEAVSYAKLALVIADEQHRFGVRQRTSLTEKGTNPHMLVMSATPIPRSLALVLYGDLDVSVINELPPGRQKVDTYFVTSAYRQRIYKFIKDEIEKGAQCYVVCPAIEAADDVSESDSGCEEASAVLQTNGKRVKTAELKAVEQYFHELREVFAGYKIQMLHGRMKQEDKDEIIADFAAGSTKILVSTTVIEVGINVPTATIMLIENAECFGLAQLHQLRGRVGRGLAKSYCIMISDSKTRLTTERLSAMKQTNDGFVISELDLKLRGPGDFFGTRQHGLPELKIANLYEDMEVLKQVQEAVKDADVNKIIEAGVLTKLAGGYLR